MASEYSYNNKNSSYRSNFQRLSDQGKENVAQVSGEFELSEFELTE